MHIRQTQASSLGTQLPRPEPLSSPIGTHTRLHGAPDLPAVVAGRTVTIHHDGRSRSSLNTCLHLPISIDIKKDCRSDTISQRTFLSYSACVCVAVCLTTTHPQKFQPAHGLAGMGRWTPPAPYGFVRGRGHVFFYSLWYAFRSICGRYGNP